MRRSRTRNKPLSMIDRTVAAGVAFVLGALTVFTLPWLLARKFPVWMCFILGLSLLIFFKSFLWCWIVYFACAALYLGFKVGVYDTMDIFNITWRTGDSHDPRVIALAESLRQSMIISAVAAMLVVSLG